MHSAGATSSGAELDLLVFIRGRRIGFEVKYSDAPRPTKSMAIARQDLKLDELIVVYPGEQSYALRDDLTVVAMRDLDTQLDRLLRARSQTPGRKTKPPTTATR